MQRLNLNKVSVWLAFWGMLAFCSCASTSEIGWQNKSVSFNDFEIIAHRGGAGLAPENSLSCLVKGMDAGADMLEVDVHLSRDGELIICHDYTIDRTTNGSGKIGDMSFKQLRRFRLVDNHGTLTDECLPTLGEVLQLVDGKCRLLIEVKCKHRNDYSGIEERLLEEIEKYNAWSWISIQSFNDEVLEKLHQLNPHVCLEKLLMRKLGGLPYIIDVKLTRFNFEKYDYISSFNINWRGVSKNFVRDIHQHGKKVKVWTLQGPEKKIKIPVDGVITDRPDLWRL